MSRWTDPHEEDGDAIRRGAMSTGRHDEDRVRRIFDDAHAPVYRYAVRRCGDPAAAEDVVAEVFLAAWRRLDDCPADHLPWLFGIARGTLSNHRRGERRRERLSELVRVEAEVSAQPAEAADHALLEALGRVPDMDREALLLVAWEGLDRRRAAKAMGCSTAAFAARLHRARKRLLGEMARPRPEPAQQIERHVAKELT